VIVETIKSVVAGLGAPMAFVYGNIYETNLALDAKDLADKELFFVYIPPLENDDDYNEQGTIYTQFPLNFFMMRKLNHATVDYKSEEVETVVDEMRELGRRFIHDLQADDLVVKNGVIINGKTLNGIESVKYLSEYAWQDLHLFGVSGQCTVPIYEGKTGCH
jgi:hypothetical protein